MSFTTLIIRTLLSPSAVTAAWAAHTAYPNILAAKNPCPPHLYLKVEILLSACHPTKVLSTQHIINKSYLWFYGLANEYFA